MNSKRSLLVIALLFISFLVYQQWQIDYVLPKPAGQETTTVNNSSDTPSASGSVMSGIDSRTTGRVITVENDVLSLRIDTLGGDVIDSDLLKYDAELNSNTPFSLMQNDADLVYVAQSGLVGKNGIDTPAGRAQYQLNGDNFKLADGQDQLQIPLTYEKDGLQVIKTFTLTRGSYAVDVDYQITNQSGQNVELQPYAQIKHTLIDHSTNLAMPTYTGGAYSSSETNYKKYSFEDMQKANLSIATKQGWVALLQHYFVTAWVPNQHEDNQLYTSTNKDFAFIGFRAPTEVIADGASQTISSKLWTGPKLQDQMETVAPNLDLTVDYGWAWFIAKPLFWLLQFIQSLVSNWGLAIIGVTIVVKAILYPLTKAQYTSMAKMRMLQPRMQELRERFGDDRQRMSQEMMKMYKEEKVNPLGGCLPILLQMPIFIALYWTFMEAVELRHAPFFGWIQDLSAQDPYYILPLLMGGSMFLLQKMSPTPVADPTQQKIMTFMPVVFTFFFLWFPAGLVLYWLVSNVITIIQQQLIYRGLEKRGLHSRGKK
ncbi:membrane protein insertase YidC [Chelonobacter oris]|uniref:Membrane protein insertase YidC n=1 Tax=Chelonobacter oris TaxID=505317 RepID=A0A0A3AUM2_9PAST|nr:membrane protein insertase YidC [Chelonobacter oris]KGQ70770.1 membrane protein insertase [Chelonobacter oris]MDH3001283.1 membrane protein insertase YidC [Chelonobacter oris]